MTSIGDTHFRYIMLPAEISRKRLVGILISVLRDRSFIQLQTSSPWRDHESGLEPFAWADFRKKIFLLSKNFNSESGMISIPFSEKQEKLNKEITSTTQEKTISPE
jgi:hypothetical protein